jgi:hypothetical protein
MVFLYQFIDSFADRCGQNQFADVAPRGDFMDYVVGGNTGWSEFWRCGKAISVSMKLAFELFGKDGVVFGTLLCGHRLDSLDDHRAITGSRRFHQ